MQAVSMRACYLFSRLVKGLRHNLRPLLPNLLVRLQPLLAHIASVPLPESALSSKGSQGMAAAGTLLDTNQLPFLA
jgi:exportin-T